MAFLTRKQILDKYEPVIGFEIHVELKTTYKMFCRCPADWFGKEPNTQTCPVCLGMPGALPVPNFKALEYTMKIAKSLNCKILKSQQFDRKHYFYPDLPKGYQITQFYKPMGLNGKVNIVIDGKLRQIRIRRIHLEEDTAKSIHEGNDTLINFNRSGVPLVEIVTEPDFYGAQEAKVFLKLLQVLVRKLGVSDADMEKGSMRLEPNISLRKRGEKGLPDYKVEVKNINSFNFAVKAIESEILRQAKLLEQGKIPVQETRGFDMSTGKTVSQRRKEVAEDYRYLTEPDIPPIKFTDEDILRITSHIPKSPYQQYREYLELGLDERVAWTLVEDYKLGALFDSIEDSVLKDLKASREKLAKFIVNKHKVYGFSDVRSLIRNFKQEYARETIDIDQARRIVKEIIKNNPKAVADYKAGKESTIQFFVGQFMRAVRRKIDVKPIIELFKTELK